MPGSRPCQTWCVVSCSRCRCSVPSGSNSHRSTAEAPADQSAKLAPAPPQWAPSGADCPGHTSTGRSILDAVTRPPRWGSSAALPAVLCRWVRSRAGSPGHRARRAARRSAARCPPRPAGWLDGVRADSTGRRDPGRGRRPWQGASAARSRLDGPARRAVGAAGAQRRGEDDAAAAGRCADAPQPGLGHDPRGDPRGGRRLRAAPPDRADQRRAGPADQPQRAGRGHRGQRRVRRRRPVAGALRRARPDPRGAAHAAVGRGPDGPPALRHAVRGRAQAHPDRPGADDRPRTVAARRAGRRAGPGRPGGPGRPAVRPRRGPLRAGPGAGDPPRRGDTPGLHPRTAAAQRRGHNNRSGGRGADRPAAVGRLRRPAGRSAGGWPLHGPARRLRAGRGAPGVVRWSWRPGWPGVLLAVGLAVQLAPVLLLPMVLTQDGPAHVDGAWVLLHHGDDDAVGAALRANYTVDLSPVPNLLTTLLLAGLLRVLDPDTAEKVVVAGFMVLLVAGLRFALRGVDRRAGWLAVAALPLAGGQLVAYGFYNFCWGVALARFVVGGALRRRDGWRARCTVAVALLLVLTWSAHPLPWVVAVLLVGGLAAGRWVVVVRRGARPWRAAATHLLPPLLAVLPGAVLTVAYLSRGGRHHGGAAGWSAHRVWELLTLYRPLVVGSWWELGPAVGVAVVLAGLTVAAVRRRPPDPAPAGTAEGGAARA